MSYFQKKNKGDSSFSNHVDQSQISNSNDDCLIVNSNIFNKRNNSQQNQKVGYSQINQGKTTSPISYLKNFKKNYNKRNQENIFTGDSLRQELSNGKQSSLKKDYDHMMNQLMNGQAMQQHKNNLKQSNQNQRQSKSKTLVEEKNSFRNNQQNSLTNNLFINDQSQQSMQQLLNSSINQFERLLQQQHENPSPGLYQKNPNVNFKKTLTKFKSILKQKLQHGLTKQKQEMKTMLNEYVQLITKLLHDKQQLSNHIEQLQQQMNSKCNHVYHLERKVQQINKQKDQHIQKTKHQIDQFLVIIQQFENQAKQENQKFQQIQKQVQRLRPLEDQLKDIQHKNISHKKYSSQQFEEQQKRIDCQSEKIQTLLQLLEKSQQETNTLKQILSKQNGELNSLKKQVNNQQQKILKSQNSHGSSSDLYQFTQQQVEQMKTFYEQKLEELQIQHEQEFIEYQKAIKQTLNKKDQCIQRLNFIISELREGKKSGGRAKSIDEGKSRSKSSTQIANSKRQQQQNMQMYEQEMQYLNENTFNDEQPIQEQESIKR